MESTFVDQLYKSLDLSGWHSQFKVLRNGSWSKLDFRGDESEVGEQEESKVPSANPWIHHYRNSKMQTIRKFPVSANTPLTDTENQNRAHNFQLRHHHSVGSNTGIVIPNNAFFFLG
ncbi:hypothetical protein PHJA_002372700 [Phtheirospermum japonicum]|uniref:Uncharacterized protein n=1 Tax=Phtheirospermum japonicum TaxID=374723 RepID=A0A830CSX1_9LAMI|nr:hypothetical protein PHJA_002372700 [Phtheirospermum japonicum]